MGTLSEAEVEAGRQKHTSASFTHSLASPAALVPHLLCNRHDPGRQKCKADST